MTAVNQFITWIIGVFLWTLAIVGAAGIVIGLLLTIMVQKERKEDK